MSVEVQITCLCGRVSGTESILSGSTSERSVCHCNSCRYNKGTLFYSALPLVGGPDCLRALNQYRFSTNITRYFCAVCGTHVCYNLVEDDSWHLSSGVIDRIIGDPKPEHVFGRIKEQIFVGDTSDGGLAPLVTGTSDTSQNCPIFAGRSGGDLFRPQDSVNGAPEAHRAEKLYIACHCQGVQFYINRPNEKSSTFSAPWPDLLMPYHTYSSDNPEDLKWWLRGPDRYLAGTCACRSCRLAFASPITCWAFIPRINLRNQDDTQWDVSGGTLGSFESSNGVHRGFCSKCAASIFWRSDERPELLDISVGIMRADEGALAKMWLEWHTGRVSFKEEAVEKEFVAGFERNLTLLNEAA